MKKLVKCEICGHKAKILTMHLKHKHSISKKEYLEQFPNASIVSESYSAELKKKSRKGKNNPSFGNGKSCNSPFSVEFYRQRNPEKTEDELQQMLRDFLDRNKKSKDQNVFCVEYWVKKGFSEEEAISKREEFRFKRTVEHIMKSKNISKEEAKKIQQEINSKWQTTLNENENIEEINKSKGRTFEQLVESYGEEKASEIIQKRLTSSKHGKQFYSDSSKKFFDRVVEELELSENSLKRGNEEMCLLDKELKKHYYYDFCDIDKKLIIEFNGIMFHPKSDVDSKIWKQLHTGKDAETVMNKDKRKEDIAMKQGFKVITVWEDDDFETSIEKIKKEYQSAR